MATYWDEHDYLRIDAEARASHWVDIDGETDLISQRLLDPAGYHEWVLEAGIDRSESRARQQAVVHLLSIHRL